MSRKKVVVAGGGMAGSLAAHLLENDADVVLIDSKEYFELRWASLRALVEPRVADRIIIPHLEYLRRGKVVVGALKATTEREVVLEDGTVHPFDFLIIATGSKPEPSIAFQDRVWYFHKEWKKIQAAQTFLVVGGGPTGVEFAGEIVTDFPDKRVTVVHSGDRLLEGLKPRASELAQKWLEKKNVEIILNDRVKIDLGKVVSGQSGTFLTAHGRKLDTDYVFIAIGSRPFTSWLKGAYDDKLDHNGRLKVDEYLRVEGYSHVFALGDITSIEEAKQGAFAQEQARRCAANIKLSLEGKEAQGLKPYTPGPEFAIVSLGRANGVAQLPRPVGTVTGWVPAMLKSRGLFIEKTRRDLGLTF